MIEYQKYSMENLDDILLIVLMDLFWIGYISENISLTTIISKIVRL
jgi:hypothetical protein